jgi:hypothetical protein
MGQTNHPSILLALHTTHLIAGLLPGQHIVSLASEPRVWSLSLRIAVESLSTELPSLLRLAWHDAPSFSYNRPIGSKRSRCFRGSVRTADENLTARN